MKNENHWEVVARDYNSPLFRNYIWVGGILEQPKLLGIPQLIVGMVSEKNNVLYCHEPKTWVACHEALKKKYIKELKPGKFDLMILNLAGKLIWAKPRRKDYQSKS